MASVSSSANRIWREPPSVFVPPELATAVGGEPVVARRLAQYGVDTPDAARRFLHPDAYIPAAPDELPGMDRAVSRLQRAVKSSETILVWGDFDVDGQTSTALLVAALRDLGGRVRYHIPNRFSEGHGIHLPTLKRLLADGADVLLTCDTGIAAHEAIAYAQGQGVDVVVTDHHALPDALPEAHAIINPMLLPEGHAMRELPGVGTAYQVMRALYGSRSTTHLLDLVALGIVADVMVQVDDTRYWLQRGLDVLRRAERPGLRVLMERARITPLDVNESDIGFALAPRLNALGRLDDANPAVELLTSTDIDRISELVDHLESYNAHRRFLSNQVYEGALAQIERDESLLEYAALVLSHPDWHTGVVGIVASRLVERFNRPVVLLAAPEDDELARGSARSVPGCDITEALKANDELLRAYGGHNMAAGMSLRRGDIMRFRQALSQTVRVALDGRDLTPELQIDAYVPLQNVTLDLAQDINRLAPFGSGNPPLVLATRGLRILRQTTLDRRGDHLRLIVADDSGTEREVVWWQGASQEPPLSRFDLAYTLRISTYGGQRSALVEWMDARLIEEAPVDLTGASPGYDLVDYRATVDPQAALAAAHETYPDLLVWREVTRDVDGVDRRELRSAAALAVWTVPPGPDVWETALAQVQPKTVLAFGINPHLDAPAAFLQRLGGLIKHTLNRDGRTRLAHLAAAMAHTEHAVRVGLAWFAARGEITITWEAEGAVILSRTGSADRLYSERTEKQLVALLRETAAYRTYWLQTQHLL